MENRKEDFEPKATEKDVKQPGKVTGRREFVAGVAAAGAAAVVAGSAMGNKGDVKSKILSRIQTQLEKEGTEGMVYAKTSHSQYLKGSRGGIDPVPVGGGSN